MSRIVAIAVLVTASAIELARSDACTDPVHFSGVKNVTIEVGNVTRIFQLSTPWEGGPCGVNSWCTGPPKSVRPLVMNWHGCSPHVPILDYAEEVSRMTDAAKDHGWYAITPLGTQAPGGSFGWNADGIPCGAVGIDDFAFFEALVDFASSELCVDMAQVHTAGFSTGAFLSYGIACRYPDLIAAAGTDAGGLSKTEFDVCKDAGKGGGGAVPMQSFHSLSDPTVPYNGTEVWAGQESMNELWRERNGCTEGLEQPLITFETDTSTCLRWDCPLAPVEACSLKDIDHCWYGGRSGGFESCVARPGDVDATGKMFALWLELAADASASSAKDTEGH